MSNGDNQAQLEKFLNYAHKWFYSNKLPIWKHGNNVRLPLFGEDILELDVIDILCLDEKKKG